jgi:hypothetical protein
LNVIEIIIKSSKRGALPLIPFREHVNHTKPNHTTPYHVFPRNWLDVKPVTEIPLKRISLEKLYGLCWESNPWPNREEYEEDSDKCEKLPSLLKGTNFRAPNSIIVGY